MKGQHGTGIRTTVAVFAVLVAGSSPAHAYIDPGTGSMLLQLAAASVAGAVFFLRDLPFRIVDWFKGNRTRQADESPSEQGE